MRPFHAGPSGLRILGLILLVAASGCAYYTTFYLARKYYREGARAQERSLTDEPSPEAATKYDLVIRQCTKLLTDYPKSKWVDDASYMLGAALYGKRDYVAAIKRLEVRPDVSFWDIRDVKASRLAQAITAFSKLASFPASSPPASSSLT